MNDELEHELDRIFGPDSRPLEQVAITIRMSARAWENFRQLVLIEKGEALGHIEHEFARARAAGDDASINDNPLNAVTRSLVHGVYESDSQRSSWGDDVWDVLTCLVATADPECNKRYARRRRNPTNEQARLIGKRVRIKSLPDRDDYYHRVVGVSDCGGQPLVIVGDDYGTFVPEVLAVHPVDSGEMSAEEWLRRKEQEEADMQATTEREARNVMRGDEWRD